MINGAPESPSTTPPASGSDGPAVADAQPAAAPAGSYHVSALSYADR
jgi:hypothetical protein